MKEAQKDSRKIYLRKIAEELSRFDLCKLSTQQYSAHKPKPDGGLHDFTTTEGYTYQALH